MKVYKISGATLRGFTLSWSGSLLVWIMRDIPPSVSSSIKVVFKKPLKRSECALSFLTFSNPVCPEGWLLTPPRLCGHIPRYNGDNMTLNSSMDGVYSLKSKKSLVGKID